MLSIVQKTQDTKQARDDTEACYILRRVSRRISASANDFADSLDDKVLACIVSFKIESGFINLKDLENESFLQAAVDYLTHKYPHLDFEGTQYRYGQAARAEMRVAIDQVIDTKYNSELLQEVTLEKLMDDAYFDRVKAALSSLYPLLDLDKELEIGLLDGAWEDEFDRVVDELATREDLRDTSED